MLAQVLSQSMSKVPSIHFRDVITDCHVIIPMGKMEKKYWTPDIPKAKSNGILMYLYRNPWTHFTPDNLYNKQLLHEAPLTIFTLDTFYTRHLLHLHHTPFTPHNFYNQQFLHQAPFWPKTFYTRHLLHQTPFAPDSFYNKELLHQEPLTPGTVYTKNLLHETPFTPDTFYNKQLQSWLQTW